MGRSHPWQGRPLSSLNINKFAQENLVVLVDLGVSFRRYKIMVRLFPLLAKPFPLLDLVPEVCNLRHSFEIFEITLMSFDHFQLFQVHSLLTI